MELLPGIGFDSIRFGQLEPEVVAALGRPSSSFESDGIRHLLYNSLESTLWFDTDEANQLEWVACSHRDLTVAGHRLHNKPIHEAIDLLRASFPEGEVEVEDFGTFESHMLSDYWLELQAEYGLVRTVSAGNFFDDEGDPVWPSEPPKR